VTVYPSLPGATGKLNSGSIIVPRISPSYVAFAASEAIMISLLASGLNNSNWAVRDRMWTVAERIRTDGRLDLLESLVSLDLREGTGTVIFRPARADERAGFPCIEASWKSAVMFGLRPTIRSQKK
jgi:hypothetical protein